MDIFAANELAETVIDQAHTIRQLNKRNAELERVAEDLARRVQTVEAKAVAAGILDELRTGGPDPSVPPAVDGSPDAADDGAPDPQE